MKILVIEQEIPNTTSTDFAPHLEAEATHTWELYKQGIIRELYFDRDHHTAVLIMECEDMEEAKDVLDTLPLVQAGLITFQMIPLVPYDGFSRLFAETP